MLSVLLNLGKMSGSRDVRVTVLNAPCNYYSDPKRVVRNAADDLARYLTAGARAV